MSFKRSHRSALSVWANYNKKMPTVNREAAQTNTIILVWSNHVAYRINFIIVINHLGYDAVLCQLKHLPCFSSLLRNLYTYQGNTIMSILHIPTPSLELTLHSFVHVSVFGAIPWGMTNLQRPHPQSRMVLLSQRLAFAGWGSSSRKVWDLKSISPFPVRLLDGFLLFLFVTSQLS